MEAKPFLIVSDVHLGAVPDATERAFRQFLRNVPDRASGLLINGDLFDFWFEYRSVILKEHYRVVATLADVVESGVPVWFVGGNHDSWTGPFLRDEVGLQIVDGPAVMDLAGRRALVAHGDGVGSGDLGYRMLRTVIRSRAAIAGFRALHPDLGRWIARRASSTHKKTGEPKAQHIGRDQFIRDWAAEQLHDDPSLDLVVVGHSHFPGVYEIEPGRFVVNAGDWINHRSFVELPAGGGAPVVSY